MNDGPSTGSRLVGDAAGDHVDALAVQALTVVARKVPKALRGTLPLFVEMLRTAALSRSPTAVPMAIERMQTAGILPAEIAERYIPAVARELGAGWCTDNVGFADVTIGTARLQGALRELGPEWRADQATRADAPCIMIVVASNVYHTLGAAVLAGRMRRAGLSVKLLLGARPDEVAATMQRLPVQAIFLSASCGESLESLRKIVEAVRKAPGPVPPVVVGGTIIAAAQEDGVDLRALVGPDFVTNDPEEALALCGITTDVLREPHREPGI